MCLFSYICVQIRNQLELFTFILSKPFENIIDFENIFKEYFNPLVNFVNKYLNNIENSKEVVQLTFVKIWENKDQVEVNQSIKSYIYRATKNAMIDYIRKNKKYLNSDDLESTIAHQMLDESDHYLDPYVVRQAIEIALMDQKPKAREIFELHKFEGLTYEEIADYLQISKRSVEDNISKILKQLKEQLKNHPELFD